jgi:hypothetical protein
MNRRVIRTVLVVLPMWQGAGGSAGAQSPNMNFFVSSIGNGSDGGNYGGLGGADARCQSLAAGVGANRFVWRAYLSTAPIAGFGGALVHARDRIGSGPWRNYHGVQVAADLQGLHANGIASSLMLTEAGSAVPMNDHDIITGTQADGTAFDTFPGNPSAPTPTCLNWTSNSSDAYVWVGHSDWSTGSGSWNDAHETTCDQAGLASTAGSGRIYCFGLVEPPLFKDGFEGQPRTLTQSTSQAITAQHTLTCNQFGSGVTATAENRFYRVFDLAQLGITSTFTATRVDFGIEDAAATAGSITLQVKLHTLAGAPGAASFPLTSLTLLHGQNVTLTPLPQTSTISIATLTAPVVVPAGSRLVVELFAPDLTGSGNGNYFIPGSNAAGEIGPTYIQASACAITNPTQIAALLTPDPRVHWVMSVQGTVP